MTQNPARLQTETERRPALRIPMPLGVTQLQTTVTTIYTAGDDADFEIGGLVVANVTAGAETVTVYFVPSGGSAGASNAVAVAVSIAANTTVRLSAFDGLVLAPGTIIQALCSTNDEVNMTGWGYAYQGTYGT